MSEYIACPYCHNPLSQSEYVKVVRCMDCTWFANDAMHGAWCKNLGVSLHDDYDGFCAWAIRRDV